MKNKLSPLSLLNLGKLKVLLSMGFKGYLADKGWFDAFKTKSAVDENGNAIPWVTYSFIDFIKDRITKQHILFEFGSGNSTIFYAKLAGFVYAVEHNKEWLEKCASVNLSNVTMIHSELVPNGTYSKSANDIGKKFNIIIVDGRDRVNCCKQAISALADDGVIVLDDSERVEYAEVHTFLKSQGFKYLPFSGIAPGVIISKYTSIFYKTNNCLGI